MRLLVGQHRQSNEPPPRWQLSPPEKRSRSIARCPYATQQLSKAQKCWAQHKQEPVSWRRGTADRLHWLASRSVSPPSGSVTAQRILMFLRMSSITGSIPLDKSGVWTAMKCSNITATNFFFFSMVVSEHSTSIVRRKWLLSPLSFTQSPTETRLATHSRSRRLLLLGRPHGLLYNCHLVRHCISLFLYHFDPTQPSCILQFLSTPLCRSHNER